MIKYEQARSLKFNVWFFVVTQILSVLLSVFAAWQHVQDQFGDAVLRDNFNTWLAENAKVLFIPGASLTQSAAAHYLALIAAIPSVHRQFVSAANLIFLWAPAGAFISVVVAWLIGHALAGYFRQTRADK